MNAKLKRCDFNDRVSVSSPFIFLWLLYFMFITATVYLDFLCKFVGLSQGTFVSRLFLFFLFMLAYYFWGEIIKLDETDASRFQIWFGFSVVVLVTFFKVVYPDASCDTLSYHLIAQRPGFRNFFAQNSGFGRGWFQVWGFSLCEKAFWYSRCFFGYRLGTVLNSIVLFITYLQIITVLNILFPISKTESKEKILSSQIIKSFFSVFIIASHYLLLNIGTYMVDAFAFPFILEGLIMLFRAEKQTKTPNHYFFAILMGLCFALKITNVVFIFPLTIIYVLKNRANIGVLCFVVSFLLFFAPSFPFVLYNSYVTGNPVFPYFNSIFRSRFFYTRNFRDWRWGPESKVHAFGWVLNLFFFPKHRNSEIYSEYNLLYILGSFGLLFWFVNFCIRIKKRCAHFENIDCLAFITIISALLWSFTTGYARYFEVGMIFFGIFGYYMFSIIIKHNKNFLYPSTMEFISGLIALMLIFESILTIGSFEFGREWGWRAFNTKTFQENLKKVLKDKKSTQGVFMQMPGTFLITDTAFCGVADSLSPSSKIINMRAVDSLENNDFDVSKYLGDTVYDIRFSAFSPDEEYKKFFEGFGFVLKREQIIEMDFGNFKIIEFGK